MNFKKLEIEGAWLAESPIWEDSRGQFHEWFKFNEIKEATGFDFSVSQSNISLSSKGTLRGIHFSLANNGQAKWITCITGQIVDVVVDIRPNSISYKKSKIIHLRGGDGRSVFIGPGLGHAFLSLEDDSIVAYLLDSPYSPEEEFEINPFDKDLNINWPLELIGSNELILSHKDAIAGALTELYSLGKLPNN